VRTSPRDTGRCRNVQHAPIHSRRPRIGRSNTHEHTTALAAALGLPFRQPGAHEHRRRRSGVGPGRCRRHGSSHDGHDLLPVHEQQASQAAPTVPVPRHARADVSTPTAAAFRDESACELAEHRREGSRRDRDRARSSESAKSAMGEGRAGAERHSRVPYTEESRLQSAAGSRHRRRRMGVTGKDATRVVYCHNTYKHGAVTATPKRDEHEPFRHREPRTARD
jgi:hypothetical protein